MSLIARLIAVGLLAGGLGQDAPNGADLHRAPTAEPCAMVFSIGHVPGQMDRVWDLRCATPPETVDPLTQPDTSDTSSDHFAPLWSRQDTGGLALQDKEHSP